jgi:hypothetical protein
MRFPKSPRHFLVGVAAFLSADGNTTMNQQVKAGVVNPIRQRLEKLG